MRQSRMFGWERNPLRRRIDRVEGGMITALIVVFLIAAPLLTAVAGHWVYGAGVRRPPLRHAPPGAQVALGEVLVASGLIALFVLVGCAGRSLVSRRRFNDWDQAWLAVAPQWTNRY